MAALTRSERRQTYALLAVYGVLGPVEVVLSGVTEALLSGHSRANDPKAVALVRDNLRQANRRMLRTAVRSISLGREDLTSLLPQITAPTLLVTGSEHSGFTGAQAEAAARLVPNGRSAVVADTAYLVPLEAPTATTKLIRKFWAQRADEVHGLAPRQSPVVGESPTESDPPDRGRLR